ncbi:MAG: PHP domain-containing protein [Ruminococcaceae bacterium]|nr:PHP domain-containing protein [Oscillospiraceae bacterium]
MKYANLHLHSTYSDAQFTPSQLILIGKSLGYKALALTDHETDGGYKEFKGFADSEGGLEILTGVEFCGMHKGDTLHIVALDYDMNDPGFRDLVRKRVEGYTEYTRKCVEYGISIGVINTITWDDVMSFAGENAWVCIDTVSNTYRAKHVEIPKDLRERVFKVPETKKHKPIFPPADEVIKVIRKAGGIAALAHPTDQTQYVPELVSMGLNGIEVDHSRISAETASLALEAAEAFRLYHCGGTDHAGPMSGCGKDRAVPVFSGITEEELYCLKNRLLG